MSHGRDQRENERAERRKMMRARMEQKRMMLARIARRDAEYAAANVPVTVEERDGRVIETRGQRCIASRF